jgi:hypothetical protein
MQTKLTLRLDDSLIEKAKLYAKRSGKSVSQMVADYFIALSAEGSRKSSAEPITSSLRGVLAGTEVDENDYRKHLDQKYR